MTVALAVSVVSGAALVCAEVVAETVLKAARAVRPRPRYTAGGLAGRLTWLRRFAPAGVMDAGIRRDLRLDAMYSIYVIFVLACIVKQARIALRAITGTDRGETDTP